jgi:hypothetical protein
MSGRTAIPILTAFVLALSACSEAPRSASEGENTETAEPAAAAQAATDQTEAAEVPEWVDGVAAIANAVERDPTVADSILEANGMTRAAFDSLLYVIAADPALTARYEGLRQ